MRKWLKGILIGVFALVLTTLGISASDSLRGASGSLLSAVFTGESVVGGCAADSVEFTSGDKTLCVDRFESAPGTACAYKDPRTLFESEQNISAQACIPVSAQGNTPWRFISLNQAQRACASAGKRLLTSGEWYRAALGTSPQSADCVLKGDENPRASVETTCRSTAGAYDMVGNVWEWIDAQATNGRYNDRELPQTGYVTGVDADGIAMTTDANAADTLYGEDYSWHSKEGVKGMLRGGFYGSDKDGGLYALNASVDLGFGSTGVGFRCVKEYPH